MEHSTLYVNMLGGFSLRWNGQELRDSDNRMRKVWLLLAYLIYRRTVVTPEECARLLWSGEEDSVNSSGALKTMYYRARTLLNRLGDGAGQTLILRRDGGYIWNPEVPIQLDVAQVDELSRQAGAARDAGEKLALQQELLGLYGGGLLPKLSSESWVMPIAAYYHRLYLETAAEVLPQLEEGEQWERSEELCTKALKIEPYSEALYCHLMRAKLARNDQAGAARVYETMSELLFSHFGVMPCDEARGLYRAATSSGQAGAEHISDAKDMLREAETPSGAMYCEYDIFRVLYQAQARAIVRSGDSIHIGLITVTGRRGAELPRKSLDRAVENLKQIVQNNLRQGDIVTQCSVSQLMVMLLQANYEDSCAVCERLTRAFFRQYPHTPADLHFNVHPLEPAGDTGR